MDRVHRISPPRGDDRRSFPGDGHFGGRDMYRQRSRSPPHRRSPPPPSKRFRRDDDFHEERYGGRYGGPDRHGPPRDAHQPMTFRQFMASLPETVTPDDAKVQYDRYQTEFWGNEARAEFEQKKNDPTVRRKFDPREIASAVEARNAAARSAATAFHQGEPPNADSSPPGPAGLGIPSTEAEKEDIVPEEPAKAPEVVWLDDVVTADVVLARHLVRTLDSERGITENELALPIQAETTNVTEESAEDGGAEAVPQEEGAKAKEQRDLEALSPDDRLAVLDRLLQYLWIVHGIDYYGARDLSGESARRAAARCTIRPERPQGSGAAIVTENGSCEKAAEDGGGDAAMEEEEKKDRTEEKPATGVAENVSWEAQIAKYEAQVQQKWRSRCESGDPLVKGLQRGRVDRDLEEFIERQIIKYDDQKWGNRLSQKLFVAKEFVVKHIKNKHGHVVDAERERLLDAVYFDNFRAAREEESKKHHGALHEGGPRDGQRGGGFMRSGGRGRGRGRGFGGPQGGMMMMDPSMMMGGPIIVPAAGPMGPVIMAPPMMMGGRGGRGGRGPGMRGGARGGRGGFASPVMMAPIASGPGYFDLDAPQNNRAVLDYGDL